MIYTVQDPGIETTSNLDNNDSIPDQALCSQQCEALHKIASKLHQLENGQRKMIQLLLNLDKELTSKEKSGTTHCSKHSRCLFKRFRAGSCASELGLKVFCRLKVIGKIFYKNFCNSRYL